MSIISDVVSSVGIENIQAFLFVAVTALLGKSSLDVANSKKIAKKDDVDQHAKIAESHANEIASLQKKVEEMADKLSKHEIIVRDSDFRMKQLDKKFIDVDSKVVSILDGVVEKPRISRAEARRLKGESGE